MQPKYKKAAVECGFEHTNQLYLNRKIKIFHLMSIKNFGQTSYL